jgi:hypothetical protein
MFSKVLASTLLPAAFAASIAKRENGGDFYSDLSLRTVGARNTLVRLRSAYRRKWNIELMSGLASMARERW